MEDGAWTAGRGAARGDGSGVWSPVGRWASAEVEEELGSGGDAWSPWRSAAGPSGDLSGIVTERKGSGCGVLFLELALPQYRQPASFRGDSFGSSGAHELRGLLGDRVANVGDRSRAPLPLRCAGKCLGQYRSHRQ